MGERREGALLLVDPGLTPGAIGMPPSGLLRFRLALGGPCSRTRAGRRRCRRRRWAGRRCRGRRRRALRLGDGAPGHVGEDAHDEGLEPDRLETDEAVDALLVALGDADREVRQMRQTADDPQQNEKGHVERRVGPRPSCAGPRRRLDRSASKCRGTRSGSSGNTVATRPHCRSRAAIETISSSHSGRVCGSTGCGAGRSTEGAEHAHAVKVTAACAKDSTVLVSEIWRVRNASVTMNFVHARTGRHRFRPRTRRRRGSGGVGRRGLFHGEAVSGVP